MDATPDAYTTANCVATGDATATLADTDTGLLTRAWLDAAPASIMDAISVVDSPPVMDAACIWDAHTS